MQLWKFVTLIRTNVSSSSTRKGSHASRRRDQGSGLAGGILLRPLNYPEIFCRDACFNSGKKYSLFCTRRDVLSDADRVFINSYSLLVAPISAPLRPSIFSGLETNTKIAGNTQNQFCRDPLSPRLYPKIRFLI
jgi:hypothetical protein